MGIKLGIKKNNLHICNVDSCYFDEFYSQKASSKHEGKVVK